MLIFRNGPNISCDVSAYKQNVAAIIFTSCNFLVIIMLVSTEFSFLGTTSLNFRKKNRTVLNIGLISIRLSH